MNIFIDTQDMEERYGEELYKEYLENQNKQLKEDKRKAIEFIKEKSKLGALNYVDINKLLAILGDKE